MSSMIEKINVGSLEGIYIISFSSKNILIKFGMDVGNEIFTKFHLYFFSRFAAE